MPKLNNKGFGSIEAIVILVLLSLISGGIITATLNARRTTNQMIEEHIALHQTMLAITRTIRMHPERIANGVVEEEFVGEESVSRNFFGVLLHSNDGTLRLATDGAVVSVHSPVIAENICFDINNTFLQFPVMVFNTHGEQVPSNRVHMRITSANVRGGAQQSVESSIFLRTEW